MWFVLMLALGYAFLLSGTSPASAQASQPESSDLHSLPSGWTSAEKWAWRQIGEGYVADFDALLGTGSDSGGNAHTRFDDPRRILRPAFLRALVARSVSGPRMPSAGIRIRGAVFDGDVDLRDAVLDRVLAVVDSRFAGKVVLRRLSTATTISFDGSHFEKEVSLGSARIGGALLMQRSELVSLVLKNAVVDGNVSLNGSRIAGNLDMNGSTVRGSLFLKGGEYAGVDLRSASIARQFVARDSVFDGVVDLNGLSAGGPLLMNGAQFRDVVLRSARVGGQLSLSDSVFGGPFDAYSMTVAADLIMHAARFDGPVTLAAIEVAGSIDLGAATLNKLELHGASVRGDLFFGGGGLPVKWVNSVASDGRLRSPFLSLWNTSIGGLIDAPESWPGDLRLFLSDFTYRRLTPLPSTTPEIVGPRHADWYVDWLARDISGSFQPYRQLAQVLESYGADATARTVLVAGRDRQRTRLPWWSPERWFLWTLRWTVGYGYGAGELCALVWALFFVLTGGVIARCTEEALPDGQRVGFWYSAEMLLPGVQLSPRYREFELRGWPRYYFRVHRLIGFVLLLFVVAGLTGLVDRLGP